MLCFLFCLPIDLHALHFLIVQLSLWNYMYKEAKLRLTLYNKTAIEFYIIFLIIVLQNIKF